MEILAHIVCTILEYLTFYLGATVIYAVTGGRMKLFHLSDRRLSLSYFGLVLLGLTLLIGGMVGMRLLLTA